MTSELIFLLEHFFVIQIHSHAKGWQDFVNQRRRIPFWGAERNLYALWSRGKNM
jgi:hypothetical protein